MRTSDFVNLLKDACDLSKLSRGAWVHMTLMVSTVALMGCVGLGLIGVAALRYAENALTSGRPLDDLAGQMIRVEPDISGLRFGRWRLTEGPDRMGRPGVWLVTTLTVVGSRPFHPWDLQATTYNEAGVKTLDATVIAPSLQPGETGEIQLRIDDAYRVTLSGRR
jgi:hypothetical protein